MAFFDASSVNGFQSANLWAQNASQSVNERFEGVISQTGSVADYGGALGGATTINYSDFVFERDGVTYRYTGNWAVTYDAPVVNGTVSAGTTTISGAYSQILVGTAPSLVYYGSGGDTLAVNFATPLAGILPGTDTTLLSVPGLLFGGANEAAAYQNLHLDATPNLPDLSFPFDDYLGGSDGNDVLYAAAGNDLVEGFTGNDLLYGGAGDDALQGGIDNDILIAGDGTDLASGGDGSDTIYGESGNDTLSGNAGDDVIAGDTGDDIVLGGDGNDLAFGGDDNDVLYGEAGDDQMRGDAGNDVMTGDAGADILVSGDGNDLAFGGDDNDVLYGEAGDDQLRGDAGDDMIFGGEGSDVLVGGEGNDVIVSEAGNDQIFGEAGDDRFVFGFSNGADVIFDFGQAAGNEDVIQFQPGTFDSYASILAAVQQVGADVVITVTPADSLTLANVSLGSLTEGDFVFA
jgi:Ca2+-binding RTX toxin-like protein